MKAKLGLSEHLSPDHTGAGCTQVTQDTSPKTGPHPLTWWSLGSGTHCAASSNGKYVSAPPSPAPPPLPLLTHLAQALSQTLCQTGRWRNHSPLWCPSSRIRPGVAHEPRQKSQKTRARANPPPYHSVSIIRNARPKLNHCSVAKKITTLKHCRGLRARPSLGQEEKQTEEEQQELVMNERGFDFTPDSLILSNS